MTIHKLARFRVKKEHLPAAVAAIEEFVAMVGKREGGTALYRSMQEVEDPTRFTHYIVFNTKAAEANHQKTAYAKVFVEALHPLCSEAPVFTEMKVVGAH